MELMMDGLRLCAGLSGEIDFIKLVDNIAFCAFNVPLHVIERVSCVLSNQGFGQADMNGDFLFHKAVSILLMKGIQQVLRVNPLGHLDQTLQGVLNDIGTKGPQVLVQGPLILIVELDALIMEFSAFQLCHVLLQGQDVLLQDLRVRMVHGLPYHGRFYGTPKVHQSCDLIHTVFPHIGTASRVDDHKTLPLQKLEGIDDRSPAHIQFRADMAGVQLFPRPVDVSDYTGLDLLIDQVVQTLVLNQINAPLQIIYVYSI